MPNIPNFNFNQRNLTPEQQRLINMYINQYNQTNSHIDLLLDMLDEIRGNIINVINITQPRRTRINRHSRNSNANINRLINQLFNERQNNYIYYDFNNPINPNIYNEYNNNNINPNPNIYNDVFTNTFTNLYNTEINNRNLFNNINRHRERDRNNNNNNNNRSNSYSTLDGYARSVYEQFFNSIVPVRPTAEQIESASRLTRFGDIENPLSESCPISLDEFNDDDEVRQLLPCGHIFHPPQFQEWFSEHVRCPVCRYDIRNYRPLSRRNIPNNSTNDQVNNTQPTTATQETTVPSSTPEQTENESTRTQDTHSDPPVSNVNVIRDPVSNQIEHLTFDITDQQFTNNFLDTIARNIFQSMLNPRTQNNNDRFMIDPSNNILFYETIIRPNNNENNEDDNN